MMKSRWMATLGLTTAASLALAGCAGSGEADVTSDGDGARVAMLSVEPEGSPWADLAWSALTELEEQGDLTPKRVAGINSSAVEQQVRAMARDGYDPVVVMQDELGAAAIDLAPSFPDTQFIVVDSHITSQEPNVQTIVIDPTGAAYIAGVVAGHSTQTGSIGFVGGMDVPNIQKYRCGLETGVYSVDENLTVEDAYAGTFVDPTKGRETAVALLEGGSDIVMHAAALSGLGVISAAKELGKMAIGADVWQGGEAPETVVWSALKDGKGAVMHAVGSAVDGDFEAGQLVWGPENGAALYDERDFENLSADLQAEVTTATEGLQSGAVTLACN